jgi:hypothetical protein
MTAEPSDRLDQRTRRALTELQDTIIERYPATTFEVSQGADDPSSIHLIAIVDAYDPDEVGELVLDRVIDLQVDDGIPIHVIPIRTPERVAADLRSRERLGRGARRRLSLRDVMNRSETDEYRA